MQWISTCSGIDDDQDPPTQSGYHQALATKVEPAADEEQDKAAVRQGKLILDATVVEQAIATPPIWVC